MPLLRHQPTSLHLQPDQHRRLDRLRGDAPGLFPSLLDRSPDEREPPNLLAVPREVELIVHQSTSRKFEIFIVAFTSLPFFMLAYFYSELPERVPQFLTFTGEVATWAEKSVISVFRVPLMAVLTQIVCLLMKYGTLQSGALVSFEVASEQAKLQGQYLRLNAALWDWFRWTVAFKMSAESLSTVFLSLERFKFLAQPAFVITAMAALIGVAGALFYLYRLLVVKRGMKASFVSKSIFNFRNKWVWIFIACIIAYALLIFFPE